MLKYENVTFIREPAEKQTKADFIAAHVNVFWLDRDKETRTKMLGAVHDLITGAGKKKK